MASSDSSNIPQYNLYSGKQTPPFQVMVPKGRRKNPQPHPTIAPTGGFYTLQNLSIQQPLSALINNSYVATNRANRTIPENAMTPDIHSEYWSLGMERAALARR